MNYLSSSHKHESSHLCFKIVTAINKLIMKPYLQAAMTAATPYMGWLRSTTIPRASSLTYLKSKNMSIFYHTSNDLEHGIDRTYTWQWLITTTWFWALYLEQLNSSSAVQEILHYGAQRFIAIRIKLHLWCLSWASSIHI